MRYLVITPPRQQREEEEEAARLAALARNAQQKSGGGEDGEEGGDAEAKRKAQRDRWERAVALFVEFSQAEERSSLELGEQIVRSLLHGEPELLPAATMVCHRGLQP